MIRVEQKATIEELAARIERIRRDHAGMLMQLRHFADAIDALELRDDVAGVIAFCAQLAVECDEHFPFEEALAAELFGEDDPAVVRLVGEHRALRHQAACLLALVERVRQGSIDAVDELILEARQIGPALTCHLCREDRELLPMMESSTEAVSWCS